MRCTAVCFDTGVSSSSREDSRYARATSRTIASPASLPAANASLTCVIRLPPWVPPHFMAARKNFGKGALRLNEIPLVVKSSQTFTSSSPANRSAMWSPLAGDPRPLHGRLWRRRNNRSRFRFGLAPHPHHGRLVSPGGGHDLAVAVTGDHQHGLRSRFV